MRVRKVGNYAALLGDFWRNPNTRALTPEARSLYCDALSHAADNLTDGMVTKAALQGMHCAMHSALPIAMPLALLTAVRPDGGSFWIDHGVAIEIVGYLDANPSKAELRAKAESGRKAAQSRWKGAVTEERDDDDHTPSNAKRNAKRNAECIPNPEPRTLPPELLTQEPAALNTRVREATAAEVASAVAVASAEVHGMPADPDWVRVLAIVDAAWERHRGVALGVEMFPGPKSEQRAKAVLAWAQKRDPGDWEGAARKAAEAAAQGMGDTVQSAFAVFAASPGQWLTAKRSKGPAPPRQGHEFAGNADEEFARIEREAADGSGW